MVALSRLRSGLAEGERFPNANELADRGSLHLPHDVGTMELHRHLADPKIEGDLLVDATAGNSLKNFALTGCKLLEAFDIFLDECGLLPSCGIHRNAGNHSIQQGLVSHRLGKKVDSTGFHRLYSHCDVAMPSQKYNRFSIAILSQTMLQIKTARSR